MQSAFIQNASIDDAKIINLAANKILANSLSAITANLGTVYAGMLQNHPTAPSVDAEKLGAHGQAVEAEPPGERPGERRCDDAALIGRRSRNSSTAAEELAIGPIMAARSWLRRPPLS